MKDRFGHRRMRDPKAERRLILWRIAIAGLFIVVIVGVVIARLYYLQIQRHGYYTTRSRHNRMQVQVIPPKRGLILDRNGQVLAENEPTYRLVVTPEQVKDMQKNLQRLSRLLDITPAEIRHFRERMKRERPFDAIPLKFNLSRKNTARFEVHRQEFPGVDIRAGLARYYPQGAATAHVVGYLGSISQAELSQVSPSVYRGTELYGKTGVELSHEKMLHGYPGSRIVEVNAEGRKLRQVKSTPPQSGRNLYLTLDTRLQKVAVNAMGDQNGAVVALNPNNGAILAMVSKPSYKPQLFVSGLSSKQYSALINNPQRPLFNRTLQGRYPPGSTIKPFIALAGLNTDGGKPIHSRYCPGWYKLPNSSLVFHGWQRGGHGWVDLHEAIEKSCDIYFYKLAHDLGIRHIHDFLARFGMGQKTGVDLPDEAKGVLPSPAWKRATQGASWYPGDTLNTGIGQGFVLVTPLQLATMTARLATRGHGARPHILKAWQDPATGKMTPVDIHPFPPIKLNSPKAWKRVIHGMRAAVNSPHGTAHQVGQHLSFKAAGKTGTAQVISHSGPDRGVTNQNDLPPRLRAQALFISFAPVEHPRIVVAVIVEHGGYGSVAAAPVARKVLNAWLGPDGIAPKPAKVSRADNSEKTAPTPQSHSNR